MSQQVNKIAFVVPTMDRPEQLHRLLTSIKAQEYLPDQIIIVNGGNVSLEGVLAKFPQLPIEHIRVQPPSLTRQKNAGVRATDPSVNLIACIDDDIVLEDGAIEAMLRFWDTAGQNVGGASFNLIGKPAAASWAFRLFFMDNDEFGKVLPSGYNCPITNAQETRPSQWLVGGATVWRREIFQEYSFNEWFLGSGLGEDLDFSYSVGKRYQLFVVADARVQHLEPARSPKSNFRAGKVQVINQVYFVRRNSQLSLLQCLWSLIGRLLGNLAKGIWRQDLCRLMRAYGNVVGFAHVITGRLPQVEASLPTTRVSQGS